MHFILSSGLQKFHLVFVFSPLHLRRDTWSASPLVLNVVFGLFFVGVVGFGAAVCWAVGWNQTVLSQTSDLADFRSSVMYVALMSFGLFVTVVLLVYAIAGFRKAKSMVASDLQARTLLKLVFVATGLVLAFTLALCFGFFRVPSDSFALAAPISSFFLLGVMVPLLLFFGWWDSNDFLLWLF